MVGAIAFLKYENMIKSDNIDLKNGVLIVRIKIGKK